jgi:virginiamycin B lyase
MLFQKTTNLTMSDFGQPESASLRSPELDAGSGRGELGEVSSQALALIEEKIPTCHGEELQRRSHLHYDIVRYYKRQVFACETCTGGSSMPYLLLLVLSSVFWSGAIYIGESNAVEITEWPVPWENTRPRDPYVDPQGRVWFCGQAGGYLAYLVPKTGEFTRFDLKEEPGPHNLIVNDAGYVWYAGNHRAHIGRLHPETGAVTTFPMPDSQARDPHTLIFNQAGDIWFTVQGGNFVGKLLTQTGEVKLIPVPTPRGWPYGIAIDSHDRPWVVLFGSNKIATVDPLTMAIEEIVLPRKDARPRRLAITSDDNIWYVDYAKGFLGRFDPKTRTFQEWALPGGEKARAYGMAADDKDRLWFVESGLHPNRLVGFDPKTEKFFSTTEIGSGGGTVRHMYFHAPTRELWFGTDTNTIGRARLP